MAKYKVVATGPIRIDVSINLDRLWLAPAQSHDRIISIAGVPMDQIPLINREHGILGRDQHPNGFQSVAIRSELSAKDFDVEIVNG